MTHHNQDNQAVRMMNRHNQRRQHAPQYDDEDFFDDDTAQQTQRYDQDDARDAARHTAQRQQKQSQARHDAPVQKSTKPQKVIVERFDATGVAVGFMLLLFCVPLWLVGAQFTKDGWVGWLNRFLSYIGFPWTINFDNAPWAVPIIVMILIGWAYSHVEFQFPFRVGRLRNKERYQRLRTEEKSDGTRMWYIFARWGRYVAMRGLIFCLLWALIISTDVGSTSAGIGYFEPIQDVDSDQLVNVFNVLMTRIVDNTEASVLLAVFLTFVPDIGILSGIRAIKKSVKP